MATSSVSDFYLACRNNDLNRVKQMLSQMNVNEINHIEITSLGESTALHAASFYGNYEIVNFLLENGADPTIMNFAGSTADDEAKTRDIQCLFRLHMMADNSKNDRFGHAGSNLEWVVFGSSVAEKAKRYRRWLEKGTHNMEYSSYTIISNYFDRKERLVKDRQMDKIKELFREAAKKHNPELIVRAYTMQTDFYRCLNEDLAATTTEILNSNVIFDHRVEEFWNTHGRIAAIIARHPKLHQYSYEGICYRGIQMTDQQLFHHKEHTCLMTKSFSSCSCIPEIAMNFATKGFDPMAEKFPILCSYTIRNKLSASYIATMSRFPGEEEVLIAPFSVFKITQITWKMFDLRMEDRTTRRIEGREIKLEECETEKSGCWIM